jgi:hypothetical protein
MGKQRGIRTGSWTIAVAGTLLSASFLAANASDATTPNINVHPWSQNGRLEASESGCAGGFYYENVGNAPDRCYEAEDQMYCTFDRTFSSSFAVQPGLNRISPHSFTHAQGSLDMRFSRVEATLNSGNRLRQSGLVKDRNGDTYVFVPQGVNSVTVTTVFDDTIFKKWGCIYPASAQPAQSVRSR